MHLVIGDCSGGGEDFEGGDNEHTGGSKGMMQS